MLVDRTDVTFRDSTTSKTLFVQLRSPVGSKGDFIGLDHNNFYILIALEGEFYSSVRVRYKFQWLGTIGHGYILILTIQSVSSNIQNIKDRLAIS